ncbi:MAG TPA: mechanosensitive ion channel domain-containing protein [Xanthobacteraceae bacterium]|nr:mechanosensitive ion channel domain-containing protein [Xanthobacteraceae bacterium]
MDAASLFTEIRYWLAWAPDWVTSIILLALAVLIAYGLHAIMFRALRRVLPADRLFVRILFNRLHGPSRLALIILVVGAVLPAIPFPPAIAAAARHALLVALVVLLGWSALAATRLGASLYLQRFRIDAPDNLIARKHTTQIRIVERIVATIVVLFTAAGILMTFEPVRQYGLSLFASAGVAGIVAGLAARPVLSNLFAGLQIAVAQPIRIDDVVIVEKEWGRVEEITSTYVVVRTWDMRRLIVPLTYFTEKPFQNWTRESTALLAPVHLYLDYTAPIGALRRKVDEIAEASSLWDRVTKNVQVTDSTADGIKVRVLLSARNSGEQWDLQCEVREKLIAFLQDEHPDALPRQRTAVEGAGDDPARLRAAALAAGE